jgi:hypothetical protein
MKSMVGFGILASAQAAGNGVLDVDYDDGRASLCAHRIKIPKIGTWIHSHASSRFIADAGWLPSVWKRQVPDARTRAPGEMCGQGDDAWALRQSPSTCDGTVRLHA